MRETQSWMARKTFLQALLQSSDRHPVWLQPIEKLYTLRLVLLPIKSLLSPLKTSGF